MIKKARCKLCYRILSFADRGIHLVKNHNFEEGLSMKAISREFIVYELRH